MASTLKDIAKVLVDKHQLKLRDAENFTNAFVDTVLEGLQNDRLVKIKGFGTFKVTSVRDRESVNVNTGERIVVSGHDKISFTPDAVMRDMVNKPFAQFETVVLADGVKFDDIKEEEEEQGMPEMSTEEVFSLMPEAPATEPQAETTPESEAMQQAETTMESVMSEKSVESASLDIPSISDIPENPINPESLEVPAASTEHDADFISQTDVDSTPESVAEPAAELIGEPVPESVGAPASEPAAESVMHRRSAIADVSDYDVDLVDDDKSECKKIFILYALISNILFAAFAFVIGYLCCSNKWLTFGPEQVPEQEPIEVIVDDIDSTNQAKIDSMRTVAMGGHVEKKSNNSETGSTEQKPTVQQSKSEQKPTVQQSKSEQKSTVQQSKSEQKPVASADAGIPDQSQYNKDARVRTGAYYIIGTQATVKVKAGQTLKSISKTYLGEGMECYVEAYNGGVTTVAEGQTIKIPKLQIKKKKTATK